MKLKISSEGIIYNDETQSAVGFLGTKKSSQDIAWGSSDELAEAMKAAASGLLTITYERRRAERRR